MDAGHKEQRADDGQGGGQQILRTVVGQFGQIEKVAGQTAHQLTGTVLIVEIKTHFLHFGEQILADVGFDPNAEGMSPIGNDVAQ